MPEKFSRKREALYNALRATTVHPTAEWLYAALRPEYPDLSLGTVYRNLKKFCAEGKARRRRRHQRAGAFRRRYFGTQPFRLRLLRARARYL